MKETTKRFKCQETEVDPAGPKGMLDSLVVILTFNGLKTSNMFDYFYQVICFIYIMSYITL